MKHSKANICMSAYESVVNDGCGGIEVPEKIIGFDLDDTLYDRNLIYSKVFQMMEAKLRTGIDFEVFNNIYQQYSIEEYELFIAGQKSREDYRNDRIVRAYQSCGVEITQKEAQEFNHLYEHCRHDILLLPGVKELFSFLRMEGYTLFILTNGPAEDQRNKIERLGIANYIPASNWFISGEIGLSKPHMEIFKFVQEKLGAQPSQMVYIGDSLANDVHGAVQSGWSAIHFDISHEATGEETQYLICEKIEEIWNLIEKIEGKK